MKRPTALPSSSLSQLRRMAIGILGLALLAAAGVLWFSSNSEQAQLWMSSCLRIGSVLCLLWLAWPQISRLHPWLILGALAAMVGVLVLARQPRVLLMGLVILIVVSRLRPRIR